MGRTPARRSRRESPERIQRTGDPFLDGEEQIRETGHEEAWSEMLEQLELVGDHMAIGC